MAEGQPLPVRVYQTARRLMVASPMPGLEPGDIEVTIDGDRVTIHARTRGPHQHDMDLLLAEWSVGPYHRELTLPAAVAADLANATYDNGVLVLTLPKAGPGQTGGSVRISLEAIEATRGEHVGHVGREVSASSTGEHQAGKHRGRRR